MDDAHRYADDPALVQQLADARFAALASEAEAVGWGEVIVSEQTPYESYQWHRLYPDDGEGYAEGTKASAVLLITVAGDGTPATIAYTRKAKRAAPSASTALPFPVRSMLPRPSRRCRGSGPPHCRPRSRAARAVPIGAAFGVSGAGDRGRETRPRLCPTTHPGVGLRPGEFRRTGRRSRVPGRRCTSVAGDVRARRG